MMDWCYDVLEFHDAMNVETPSAPGFPSDERLQLRIDLIQEEFGEFLDGCDNRSVEDVADALADLIYVSIGTALEFGIDLRPVWAEVQRSNMDKVGSEVRADGKILKPKGWRPPNIAGALKRSFIRKRVPERAATRS